MRRIARWTLSVLTAVSLGLCVVAVGLWVRNAWADDGFHCRSLNDAGTRQRRIGLVASAGHDLV